LVAYPPHSEPLNTPETEIKIQSNLFLSALTPISDWTNVQHSWVGWLAGLFLVSVPVFFQAPLVRALPWLSLILTLGWLGFSLILLSRTQTRTWGSLLMGFSWTWLAGSVYWGWFRWEPLLHLPIEAIALPLAIGCLLRGQLQLGSWFYLGSLFGTAVTDLYFYLVDLIPYWRHLMADPAMATSILNEAIGQVKTLWGVTWAVGLASGLLTLAIITFSSQSLHKRIFSGTMLGTILVDALFWLAASLA